MITTILIVLVAVVVLIVIIAVLALHFLRADDSDTFDDVSAEPPAARRMPAVPPREPVSTGGGGRGPRHPEPPRVSGPRDIRANDRQIRPDGGRPAGYRDRDTGPRPAVPDRRNGQSGSRSAVASARPAKSAKTAGADSNAKSWESLSDVDYWAELSADKPQVTPAPASERSNGAARRGRDSKPAGRRPSEGRGPAPEGRAPASNGSLPARPRQQSSRPGAGPSAGRAADPGQTEQFDARAARTGGFVTEPATQSLAALARLSGSQSPAAPRSDAGLRPASGQPSGSGSRAADGHRPGHGRRPSEPAGFPRNPAPADDDPLTSPSFPAINTSDSRSYRGRRSTSGAHAIPQPGPQQAAAHAGGFAEPTAQYPVEAGGGPPQMPTVANPYGSYVSAVQPTYQEQAQPRQELPGYGAGYGNGHQPDGTLYSGPVTGYLPNHGYGAGNGNGYSGDAYRDQHDVQGGYGGYEDAMHRGADYQPAQSMAGGYGQQNQAAGQFDERGYAVPDLAYGQDGYQGYTGYRPGSR